MQSIYAVLQARSDDLKKQEKFLLFNIHKSKDLYVLQLLFLLAVRDLALEHIEIKKKKYLATDEDRNPNCKPAGRRAPARRAAPPPHPAARPNR